MTTINTLNAAKHWETKDGEAGEVRYLKYIGFCAFNEDKHISLPTDEEGNGEIILTPAAARYVAAALTELADIKEGKIPFDWEKFDMENKVAQAEVEAEWNTIKEYNGIPWLPVQSLGHYYAIETSKEYGQALAFMPMMADGSISSEDMNDGGQVEYLPMAYKKTIETVIKRLGGDVDAVMKKINFEEE